MKNIWHSTGCLQKLFASHMGVSDKTVEAWEMEINHPSGVVSRILSMMEMNAELTTEFQFVQLMRN